jgi:hypothetical protein
MSAFSRLKLRVSTAVQAQQDGRVTETDKNAINEASNTTKDFKSANNNADTVNIEPKDLLPDQDAQRGIQQVEAVTLTWTRSNLIAVFIL